MDFDIFKADAETFVKELGGANATKVADVAGLFVAQKLRERSFMRQIITPRTVTRYDLQVSTDHDQLEFIAEKEVNVSPARAIAFKGEPEAEYIEGNRFRIGIFEIASKIFEKKEIELLAYTQPVTKLIEDNTVREIEEVEDVYGLQALDQAAAASGNLLSYSTGAGGQLTKGALKAGINAIDSKRLLAKTVLMSKVTYNDFLTFNFADAGSELIKEITIEGYRYYNFGGMKLIVSLKDELFRHPTAVLASGDPARMIYVLAEEKALGFFLILDSTKFGVQKVFNTFRFQAWEYIGMGLGNTAAVARVTLLD